MIERAIPIEDSRQQWRTVIWTQWVWIWLIGVVIGVPMMGVVYVSGIGPASEEAIRAMILLLSGANFQYFVVAASLSNGIISLLPGAIVGAVVGVVQWFVLHRDVRIGQWVVMTVLGGALGWWVASTLFIPVNSAVVSFMRRTLTLQLGSADIVVSASITGSMVGYVGGAIVGAAQWLGLRRFVRYIGWWVLASATGWSMLWAIGGGVFAIFILSSDRIVF